MMSAVLPLISTPTLGLAGWVGMVVTPIFLIVSVLMILIVLIQRPQGGGLSGAFGASSGSGQTAFGAKTGDALTFATIGIFVAFLLLAILLNFAARPSEAQPQNQGMVAPADEAAEEIAEEAAGITAEPTGDDAAADDAGESADPAPAEESPAEETSTEETPADGEG